MLLISIPLLAQRPSQPWGLLSGQMTTIESTGGMSVSPAGDIYVVGGNGEGVPTKVLGDVSHWSTFLVKEDINGKVLFAVQIGGSLSIGAPAFDAAGNAYIIGNAADSGFAPTSGAYQSASTEIYAPFACKFRFTDGTPVYCTFLPATSTGLNMAVDPAGNLYYSGHFGASVLTTPGALAEGGHSLFVGKLDPTGAKLIYQAAFGGSSVDYQDSMAVDASGNVYVTGRTYSADFPITPNAAVPVFPGKDLPPDSLPFASFVTKLNPTGSALVFSTFGGLNETPLRLALNADKTTQILVEAPSTQNSPEKFLVRRFSSDGTAILFATNLNVPDAGLNNPPLMAVDTTGNTSLFGTTAAVTFPTLHPTQSCGYPQDQDDIYGYLVRMSSSGAIIQSTFLQGAPIPIPVWFTATGSSASIGVTQVFSSPSGEYVNRLEILNIGPTSSGEVDFACIGNAASFRGAPIAPYEIVSLFGQNLGPTEPVNGEPGPDGRFPSSLGNTKVTFDGVPAPLLYVSANQLNAVAPAGLSSKNATEVCVIFQSSQTNCINAGIAPTSPGIFLSGAGTKNELFPFAAAVNQDGTANSEQNPAKVGSILSIYATGLGMTTPAPADGAVVQLPLPTNQLALQILTPNPDSHNPDPIQLKVFYAGPAPFEVAGITQINVEVPQVSQLTIQVVLPDGTTVPSQTVQIWTKP
jgi:uncharacterized protein (TIGR03437 family)